MLLDVRRGFRLIEVLDDGRRVRVQGGATLRSVNARLAPLWSPPRPGPVERGGVHDRWGPGEQLQRHACGTEQNAYRTLDSVDLVLASGTWIDTSAGDAEYRLRVLEPVLYEGLQRLRDPIRGNAESVRILRSGSRSRTRWDTASTAIHPGFGGG